MESATTSGYFDTCQSEYTLDPVANCHNPQAMSKSIRISDELAGQAEGAAVLTHRSPPQQIEHWAQIGRILEPALSYHAVSKLKSVDRSDLDAILASVETAEGTTRSQSVIKRTSASIESTD